MSRDVPNPESVFADVIEIESAEKRAAFLDQACCNDPEFRREMEKLVLDHFRAGPFLESPAAAHFVATVEQPSAEPLGTVIGPYKLMEQIGEGGMGLVYVAEQHQPVRRKVALKLIKPGMDTRQVIARFEAERQALALMDHPNIARVIDGGATASGRPYFVMELVRGVPITEYCDEQRLTPRARLELFRQVCAAVQHAHQKGIIHRDIKPSNVLVVSHDGTPVVKVIDFGVAKAIGQQLTEKTVYTQFAQFIGTPLYMSPEQAGQSGLDIDTRTDVYALGVLLYELLTGATPFDRDRIREADYQEIRRIIREEEPPRPSTRMSTLNDQAGSTISAQRQISPRELSILLRGELDWIVMKSLEKDRNRRYESASAMAADVERYLNYEPVLAGPPSRVYRIRKFLRRNRALVATASAIVFILVGGIIGTTWGLLNAQSERDTAIVEKRRADDQTAIAKAVTDFLQEALLSQASATEQIANGNRPDPNMTVRTLLDRAAAAIEGRFGHQPLTEAAIRYSVGKSYWTLGEYAAAERHLKRSVDLRKANLGADHDDTVASKHELAIVYVNTGRIEDGIALSEQLLETARTLGRSNAVEMHNLAVAYEHAERYEDALKLYQVALKLAPGELNNMIGLGLAYINTGRRKEGVAQLDMVLAKAKETLGDEDPLTLRAMWHRALAYSDDDELDQAMSLFQQVAEKSRTVFGPDHPTTLIRLSYLGTSYRILGQHDKAIAILEELLQKQQVKPGPRHRDTLKTMNFLALAYQDTGKLEKAEVLMEELVKRARGKGGLDPAAMASILDMLGNNLRKQKKHTSAERVLNEALAMRRELIKSKRCSPEDVASSLDSLGINLLRQEKYVEAEPFLRECLSIYTETKVNDWNHHSCTARLGEILLGRKKYEDAEPLLLEGYAGMKQHETRVAVASRIWLTNTVERIVRLYEETNRPEKAREWRDKLPAKKGLVGEK